MVFLGRASCLLFWNQETGFLEDANDARFGNLLGSEIEWGLPTKKIE